jgi:uncharacterized protein YndB with AHSA1/START domain
MATSVVDATKSVTIGARRLECVRVFKANRKRVFDAWTRPEMIRQWFGPGGMWVPEIDADAKVDGKYNITLTGAMEPGGEERTGRVEGRYTRVEPYDVIAFTWSATWAPGEESEVTISLKDVNGGTEMTLVHDGFGTEGSRDGHAHGWSNGLEKLRKLVEAN